MAIKPGSKGDDFLKLIKKFKANGGSLPRDDKDLVKFTKKINKDRPKGRKIKF